MPQTTLTERVVRRERAIIALAIVLVAVLAWLYVVLGAGTGMSTIAMTTWQFPPPRPATLATGDWSPGYWATMLVMWWVMMIAMMTPSAAPMILLYARVARHGSEGTTPQPALAPGAAFAGGYLACWLGFSVLAVAIQFGLEALGLLDGMTMWSVNEWLTGGLFLATALYQLSPTKAACLDHCRSPAAFLARNRRPGRLGAFRMGLIHGAHCVGCCWVLMLLLFAAGVMNLVWIAGLTAFVLVVFGASMMALIGDFTTEIFGQIAQVTR